MPQSSKVRPFDRDAGEGGGYVYTTNHRTSSRIALQRHFDLIREAVTFDGRSVLDIGCGDGFSTERFFDEGSPRRMVGLDPAPSAIAVATRRRTAPGLHFVVGDGHRLPWPDDSFDLVLIQGVLHHDDKPLETIREAFRVAPEVLILEPNGNNLGLKENEKRFGSRVATRCRLTSARRNHSSSREPGHCRSCMSSHSPAQPPQGAQYWSRRTS